MRKGTEVRELAETIVFLEKSSKRDKASVWKRIADILRAPRRKRAAVNLGKISKIAKEGAVVAVPGKVLGKGTLKHPLTIACISSSQSVRDKVGKTGGKLLSFKELATENPKGSGVIIIR